MGTEHGYLGMVVKNKRSYLPSAEASGQTLYVRFLDSPATSSVEVACVIDQTHFGDVIGVEILDLRRQLSGGVVGGPRASGRVRWSYDSEIDAFYVHVMEGNSQVQTSATGKVSLDTDQRVVLMEIPVPPATL
jgi:uncharacterized protein YuzE